MPTCTFPADFVFGAATASYQIEGAWNEDGKAESIWDRHCHTPGKTSGGQTGDVACDHYHRWQQDVALMAGMGLNAYRFSIAWPRVLPQGRGAVEQRGIDFYSRLADALLAAGIAPFATLYHWDMPMALWEKHQGWMSRDVAGYFADYADLMFRKLGDRITNWITHNEPRVHMSGYIGAGSPPCLSGGLAAGIRGEHHILLSHGMAVQAFRASGRKGQIGITLSMGNALPLGDSAADARAAANAVEHDVYWDLDVLHKGSYPELARAPAIAGMFPATLAQDCRLIHAAGSDFIGINHYRINWAEADDSAVGYRFVYDQRVPVKEQTGIGWPVVPEGMYQTLMLVHRRYPGKPIYVTENGYADDVPLEGPLKLDDPQRESFLQRYLASAHRATQEGANLKGYFVWSLMDNFEWGSYSPRFGLIAVDYRTLERTLKRSAKWYSRVIRERGVTCPPGNVSPGRS